MQHAGCARPDCLRGTKHHDIARKEQDNDRLRRIDRNGQFFRIELGAARFVLSQTQEHAVGEGGAVPPIHPEGTVHETKADAEATDVQPA